jgi:pimeloyl-ACP methyl ester carboxylesterase
MRNIAVVIGTAAVCLLGESSWAAAPCTAATPVCTETVMAAGAQAGALIYRSHPLDARNESITRALIMVHGQGRDADGYFRTAAAAAFLAGGLEDTLVIAPRFASNDSRCRDALAPNELNWTCFGAESWRNGAEAIRNASITSFDVMDEIVRRVARAEIFPNLKAIVVAGHSAGGQFVGRYGMANQAHDRVNRRITYVVANPSSYTYLDNLRPTSSADRDCTGYDTWPYGLQKRSGYSAKLADDQLKKQLAARPVTYLVGELDILPLYGFDSSCSAMAQGPTRLARGLAFGKYVNENHGAQHKTLVVPACGHSARCMFTAERVLPLIVPKE